MTNPWVWRDHNPYYATAFQVLDLEPTADRATARARIAARRKRISYDAKRFPLFGTILSVAEVNAAEEQLSTAPTRLAAELLTHRPESAGDDLADLAELLELAETLGAATESTAAPARPTDQHRVATPELNLDYTVLPRLLPAPAGVEIRPLRADKETTE